MYKNIIIFFKIKKKKEIKNKWQRRDPCFLILTILFLIVICLAYALVFGYFLNFKYIN